MNESTLATLTAWSYGIAAIAYVAFAIRMALGWRRSSRALLLFAATLATAAWAAMAAAAALIDSPAIPFISGATDVLRYAAWFGFVGNLLSGWGAAGQVKEAAEPVPRWAYALAGAGLLASYALGGWPTVAAALGLEGPRPAFGLHIGLAVFGLMLVEQLFRQAQPQARWAIKPICLALGSVFGFELFLYADAMLFARLDADIWAARGIANALVIPLIAIATARNTGWTVEMHLSRGAMFQSTALLVSGAFLLVVAAAGYAVRYLGGDWGRALQIEVLFAAVLAGVLVASSGRFRSKLKVFISKHFFSYRYDYREEWLRFTRTLSTESSLQGAQERAVVALASLVESPAGMLWLMTEQGDFRMAARWNLPAVDAVEPRTGSLVHFMERTGWVIDLAERETTPERYVGLTLPAWLESIRNVWLVAPLSSGTGMLGFVVLTTPRAKIEIDWEVRDLLQTAGLQAASYLGQLRASEALLEARKFDAFNRMSAFVVHDLKNLIAQLSLMIRNAERHRDNPEFQRDMLVTVEHVVERMNRLMLQLRTGATPVESPRPVVLEPVVRRVCSAKAGNDHRIELNLSPGVVTLGHEDQLEHVIAHLVQNAIDATDGRGMVSVKVDREGRFSVIEVNDNGIGMSPEFVRERLFKPFETTKKAGMGIGVYESSQYVTALGGQMIVDSKPSIGTRVRVLLPFVDIAIPSSTSVKSVA